MRSTMIGALIAASMLPTTAASAGDGPTLRCFKVQARSGGVERICESAGFVTIEAAPEGDAPSPAVLRAHAVQRFPPIDGAAPQAAAQQPVPATPIDWSGLRVGLGPWGALSHPAASSGFGLAGRVSYDIVPADAPALVIGVALEQAGRPALNDAAGPRGAPIRAVTSLNLRLGTVLWGRVMPYVTAGLASSTRHLAIGGGSDVGAGVAYAADGRWSVSLDYRHIDLRGGGGASGRAIPGRSTAPVAVDGLAATLNCKVL